MSGREGGENKTGSVRLSVCLIHPPDRTTGRRPDGKRGRKIPEQILASKEFKVNRCGICCWDIGIESLRNFCPLACLFDYPSPPITDDKLGPISRSKKSPYSFSPPPRSSSSSNSLIPLANEGRRRRRRRLSIPFSSSSRVAPSSSILLGRQRRKEKERGRKREKIVYREREKGICQN